MGASPEKSDWMRSLISRSRSVLGAAPRHANSACAGFIVPGRSSRQRLRSGQVSGAGWRLSLVWTRALPRGVLWTLSRGQWLRPRPVSWSGRRLSSAGTRALSGRVLRAISILTISRFVGSVAIVVFGSQACATEARYECSGDTKLTAQFSRPNAARGRVALTLETGRKIVLPQVISADGGRYADTNTEFWIKGRNATLTRRGAVQTCSMQ
jgi:membrane-bound inhibitor of C-type lysozyme